MIKLKIMTPDQGVCYENQVKYLDIKTSTGHIGLQKNITPMIASIENGMFKIKLQNDTWVSGILCKGTLYVDRENGIKVFASAFKWTDEIDINLIQQNIQFFRDKINNNSPDHKEYTDWTDQLLINENLLEAYNNK